MPAKFAKRHYVAIAEALHLAKPHLAAEHATEAWRDVVNSFIATLAADNENFQADRFAIACEDGINAKGVGAGIQGGPAMPYFQGNTPMDTGRSRAAARRNRR